MFTLIKTASFRKSLKRFSKSWNFDQKIFEEVIHLLTQGKDLPPKFKDHALSGNLKGLRECHLANDLLLIYEVDTTSMNITISNMGSHSYLFE